MQLGSVQLLIRKLASIITNTGTFEENVRRKFFPERPA